MICRCLPNDDSDSRLYHGSERSNDGWHAEVNVAIEVSVGCFLRAIAGDVASLTALVASFASSVEWAAIRGRTVTRDVTEFTTSIALHGLCLTISSEVVWSATFVACCRSRAPSKSASWYKSTLKASTRSTNTTAGTEDRSGTGWVWARTRQVSWLTTVVASPACTGSAQAQSWAVCLNMTKSLAVVALLSLGSSR